MVKVLHVHDKSFVSARAVEAPPTASDQLVGKTSTQTLTNKTLTTPTHTMGVQAVAAAGSVQGDATAITAASGSLIHGTGADAAKGIKLPAAAAGSYYFVKNGAAAVLKLYPATGDAINALAANASLDMAANTSAVLVALDGTTWFSFSLLPS